MARNKAAVQLQPFFFKMLLQVQNVTHTYIIGHTHYRIAWGPNLVLCYLQQIHVFKFRSVNFTQETQHAHHNIRFVC